MKKEDLRKAIKTEPFQPFILRMVSGAEYLVDNPENLWVPHGDASRTIAVYSKEEGAVALLDLPLVEAIERQPPRRTGSKKKRRSA